MLECYLDSNDMNIERTTYIISYSHLKTLQIDQNYLLYSLQLQ